MANNEIVVGFDVSPSARAALEWAAQQARSTGWNLRALHVVDWASVDNMYPSRSSRTGCTPTT